VRASHRGYSRVGVEHQRTVQLSEHYLLLTDELRGTGTHSLDLRFILGPAWRVRPEKMFGEAVSSEITGPRRLNLLCEAESGLAISVQPADISREYGVALPVSCILIQTAANLPARVQTKVQWD
jgi:hypothetical protein